MHGQILQLGSAMGWGQQKGWQQKGWQQNKNGGNDAPMGQWGGQKRKAPTKAEREMIEGPRQTGTVVEWKGTFGWIKPSKEIKHANAHKHDGKIYLGSDDVAEELDGVGSTVNFNLYADSSGMGALDCRNGAAPVGNVNNSAAKGKGTKTAPAQSQASEPAAKKQNAGQGNREILHDEPLIGTVTEWKGTAGWVKPHDTIEHPLMQKQRGDLHLLQADVKAEIDGVGATVQFILYKEGNKLGAANVKPPE